MVKNLTLRLKGVYFDQIKAGAKSEEYRLVTPYWKKRLEGKTFDNIIITKGYPKSGDTERTLIRPWKGLEMTVINHEHFGEDDVLVYAIKVN
jgi:hypothetical protein